MSQSELNLKEDIVITVENLKKWFPVRGATAGRLFRKQERVHAVDGVSFDIKRGENFGLIGESGSGKTTIGRCILRLIEPTSGKIYFKGRDVTSFKGKDLKNMRREMQIVMQDPFSSLDLRLNVFDTLMEPLLIHKIGNSKAEREKMVENTLETMQLTPIEYHIKKYPHELSGGERQRVALGRALILQPTFIVLDEPVSMLDVSIRAGILNLILNLRNEFGFSQLFISHDLALTRHICDRIAVCYLGKQVEQAHTSEMIGKPLHPYTQALISAAVHLDSINKVIQVPVKGEISSLTNPPSGCRFHPRCPHAEGICRKVEPNLINVHEGHYVACHRVK